jgi:hypothetical protein
MATASRPVASATSPISSKEFSAFHDQKNTTILECAQIVLEVTGSSSTICFEPLPQDDPTRRRPDISKAKRALGWKPKISLRDGLLLSLDHFRQSLKADAVKEHRSHQKQSGKALVRTRPLANALVEGTTTVSLSGPQSTPIDC